MDRPKVLSLVAVVLAAVSGADAQSSDAKGASPRYSISIRLPEPTVKAGSPITVDLALTNLSSEVITFDDRFIIPYNIEVRDAGGLLVALTDDGKEYKRRLASIDMVGGSGAIFEIKPGNTLKQEIGHVNDLYEMSKPGVYKIQFHYAPPGGGGVAHSNVVTVTVT